MAKKNQLTKAHFDQTYKTVKSIEPKKFAVWLLNQGYYPESYVLPPNFYVEKVKLKNPFFISYQQGKEPSIPEKDLAKVSFPKDNISDITFGIISPKIYHDLCYWINGSWPKIINHMFTGKRSIFSYSFPIPINTKDQSVTNKRAERMIYEYIEGAEKDLLLDGINHRYVVQIDIKNFYPSVYTHSISWALSRTRKKDSNNRKAGFNNMKNHPGNKIDILLQKANSGQTNGIPIGPALSDLIAEIILSAIDRNIRLPKNCFGIRFKDDYRILCNDRSEAKRVIKIFKRELDEYNFVINSDKTKVSRYPEGLSRPWIVEYDQLSSSLRVNGKFTFRAFKSLYSGTITIHKKYSSQGTIEKMLSEVVSVKKARVRVNIEFTNNKEILLFLAYVWRLKDLRQRSLGVILGIVEYYYDNNNLTRPFISQLIIKRYKALSKSSETARESGFEYLWLFYFIKTNRIRTWLVKSRINDVLNDMFKEKKWQDFFEQQNIFKSFCLWKLTPKTKSSRGSILQNVSIFQDS